MVQIFSSKCATNGNILFIKKAVRMVMVHTVSIECSICHVEMIYDITFSVKTANVVCDLVAI